MPSSSADVIDSSEAISLANELVDAADSEALHDEVVIQTRAGWAAKLNKAARLMPDVKWIPEHARRIEQGEGQMLFGELDMISLGFRTEVAKLTQ